MITMLDGNMAAAGAVLVIMVVVVRQIAVAHGSFLSLQWCSQAWSIALSIRARTWLSAME
ncbi:hypothetical protein FHX05_005456 [Rhizobium sp. BK491]|nr:hypothetical protein [Rhizobium sp. BK491]